MIQKITENITCISKLIIKPEKEFSFLSYFIKCGGKNILIDTLPDRAFEDFSAELENLLGDEKLDIIVVNHSESDHSGCLPYVLKTYPEAEIYGTENAKNRLIKTFDEADDNFSADILIKNYNSVNTGDMLTLGDQTFTFIETPGLHWDDNMVTFWENEQVLFSNDMFGSYCACAEISDEDYDTSRFEEQLGIYFGKVFSSSTEEEKTGAAPVFDLPVKTIATGHGIVIRKNLDIALAYYQQQMLMASNKVCP